MGSLFGINRAMRPEFFVLFVAYLALLLGTGLAFARRMKSAEDFFLAGKRLGAGFIFISLTASWFGATSMLVSTDEALRGGVSAIWIVGMPAVLTVIVLAVFFAGRLHRLPVMTWSDLVELRYGRLVRHLTSVLLVWYMALLAASQMAALGLFLEGFLSVSYGWSLAAGAAVVLVYSAAGGLRSVVRTDLLQVVLLTAGVSALLIWVSGRSSWAATAAAAFEAGKAGYFDLFDGFGTNALMLLSFTLAWTISPIALQRIQAARSARAARKGLWATAAALLVLYLLIIGIGTLSLPLYPRGTGDRPLVAEIAGREEGFALGGLVFVAVLAAILSTLDTAMNAGALVMNRDIINQAFPNARKRPIPWARAATLMMAVLAFLVALKFRSILKTIGLSSEIMAEGFFVPGAAMLVLRDKRPLAGLLGIAFGGGFAVLSFLGAAGIVRLGLPVWPYSVPYGLALGAAGFFLGLSIEKRRSPSRRGI
jgi:SSS family solute:Na+ symporter